MQASQWPFLIISKANQGYSCTFLIHNLSRQGDLFFCFALNCCSFFSFFFGGVCVYINLPRKKGRGGGERNSRKIFKQKRKKKMDGLRCSYGQYSRLTLVSLFVPLSLCLCLAINNVAEAFDLHTVPFNEGFSPLFGDGNLVRSPDGKAARLLLDRFTGIILLYKNLMRIILLHKNLMLKLSRRPDRRRTSLHTCFCIYTCTCVRIIKFLLLLLLYINFWV